MSYRASCPPFRKDPRSAEPSELARVPLLEEAAQLGGRLELRNGLQILERRRERIGQAPKRSGLEFFVLRIEIEIVDPPGEMFRHVEFALDERLINDHLCGDSAEFRLPPRFDLLLHWAEIPLHPIHADGNRIEEIQ